MKASNEYAAEAERWHEERERQLRSREGWLALVGLHWLTPGDHEFGQHPSNAIRLSGRDVPPLAGHLLVTDDLQARVRPHHEAGLTHDSVLIENELPLIADTDGDPTVIGLGSLRMHLIRRGANHERLALRVRDTEASALAAFTGVPRFSVDPAWRLEARLERPSEPRTIAVPDSVGDVLHESSPGEVILPLRGGEQRLHALEEEDDKLWLIFGDATNGEQTYAAGRFLVTGPVQPDGSVAVDFNLAYNPPCVFSPYATCPLPPAGNRLTVPILAGEMLPAQPASVSSSPG
ncbi:MAG: DUF1684 domain-containing protein [Candidatus Limnocylindria bacterium]